MDTTEANGRDTELGRGEVGPLMEGVAERLARTGNARALFGDPIERNGRTVIPVAQVRFGFGAGGGRRNQAEQRGPGQGLGGGAGGLIQPVGFIVMDAEKPPRFRRIRIGSPAARNLAFVVGAWLIGRAIVQAFGKPKRR
jgi:uncharacterized spore protein YtfJ